MKRFRIGLISALLVLFATLAFSQQPRDENRPPEPRQDEAGPQNDRQQPPARQDEPRPETNRETAPPRQDEARPRQEQPQRQENGRPPRDQARPAQQDRRDQGRPDDRAARGQRIPQDRFRASFGRQHTFVINRPVIVEGQPRFQYAGYWFEIVDPWPADWLYTDDCYVDYMDDQYYLFDVLHPGTRVALIVIAM